MVLGADLEAEVKRIKGEHEGDILINGSVSLVGALSGTGLIDEYRLMVFPAVLGSGKRLSMRRARRRTQADRVQTCGRDDDPDLRDRLTRASYRVSAVRECPRL